MTGKFQVLADKDANLIHDEKKAFMQDVMDGFSKANKQIPSKYFYDKRGSELFNQITYHPDYYLTRCELDILNHYKRELSLLLRTESFNLIELGPGEGIKTRILLDEFLDEHLDFTYFTIDISKKYLCYLLNKFNKELPELETLALNADYLSGLKWLGSHSNKRNFLLFLGSSIGNFDLKTAQNFLAQIRHSLQPGDYLLIGFDLLKDIDILLRAYNDSDGITRDFNLNLLTRMNRELGANFNLADFYHYGTYNVYTQAMESYLISNKAQIVYIDALRKSFGFKKSEPIHLEISQKYQLSQIEKLAHSAQFKIVRNFHDKNHYFINSLWQA